MYFQTLKRVSFSNIENRTLQQIAAFHCWLIGYIFDGGYPVYYTTNYTEALLL